MSSPFGMYGGFKYESPTTRALSSITVESYEKVYDDQAQFMSKLAGDVSFLAANGRKQQAGIDKANENFIQQFQDMINDVITLLGGGGDTGFDFGDLRYVLIAIGALFGFTDDNGNVTVPLNLFQAAWHFFSNYILPVDNFKDAMNFIVDNGISTVLDFLGEIPIVGQAAQQLGALISDIRDALGPLIDAIDAFFNAFNLNFTDTGGITGLFGPFAPILDSLNAALSGVHLPDFTPMFQAFAQWTEPFIQLVADVINAFSPLLTEVINMGSGIITPLVDLIAPLMQALAPIMDLITEVVQALQPFLDLITGILSMFDGDVTMPSDINPVEMISNFTTNFINPSTWFQDISSLFGGFSGIGTGDPSFITNIIDEIPLLNQIPFLPELIQLLGPFLQQILGILNMFGIGSGGTGFNPATAASTLITDFLNPSGLLASAAGAVMDWAQLGLSLFGLGGLDQSGFSSVAQNFFSFLGSPNFGSGFNIFSAAQNFLSSILTPAGALSSFTQIPGHLYGVFAPGNLTNMLPDPGFDNSDYFDNPDQWDGTVGRSLPLGSLKFIGNGTYQQFVGVPIGTDASQVTNVGMWTTWKNLVVTPGKAIVLAVDSYDINDNLIPNANRVVMGISNPTTNASTYTGASSQQPPIPAAVQDTTNGDWWVYLSGPFMPPAGTSFIRISPEITTYAQSGQVNFDDGYQMPDQGLIDSSILSNFENLLDGSIPGIKVGGLQGIADIIGTFATHIDGLFNALNIGGATESGVPFFGLFDLMQQTGLNAFNAAFISSGLKVILDNKVNKSIITGGLQPSGEMNFNLGSLADGVAMPTTTLATGQAMAGWIRASQAASKGFIDFYASKAAAGTTGIYSNLYKQDITTGGKTRVYQSPDIAAVIPTGVVWTNAPVSQMLIPGGVPVAPNDLLWFELVNNSGANLVVGKRTVSIADHFNTTPKNVGHTRAIAALGVSPASLNGTTDAPSSQTAPLFTAGIAVVPVDYHLPQMDTMPPGAGVTPWTPPSFLSNGDVIDLTGVGGGGSGQSEWDAGIMAGGLGGTPAGRKFVYGSDINGTGLPVIPAGHTLYFRAGAGGAHPGFYWADGNPGAASQWWLDAVDTGTLLLSCPGGPGGSGSVGLSSGTGSGPTPNPFVFDGHSFPMGQNVGINSTGSSPGGGGGGATWYELGGSGAPGGGWAFSYKTVG